MKIDAEIFDLCKDFIKDNEITCVEDIYRSATIEANALELLEQICELIGYHDYDEEEDLDFEDE